MKNFIQNTHKILLATLVLFLVVEISSYLVLKIYYNIKIDDGRNPLLYSDENIKKLYPKYSIEEARAMLSENWNRNQHYEPLVEHSEGPYNGAYVNISELGYRKVHNQVDIIDKNYTRIFIFGGSTTFGYGVSDRDTIASQLQEMIENDKGINSKYSVFNFGAGYWYSTLERIKLFKLINAGIVPDIAIFIDGLNDFSLNAIPDLTGQSRNIKYQIETNKFILFLQSSNTFKLLNKILRRIFKPIPKDHGDAPVVALVKRFENNRIIIKESCDKFNINTLFVQQPIPYYEFDNINRIVPLSDSHLNEIHNVSERIKEGYRIMFNKYSKKEYNYLNLLWIGNLKFDGNQYIDYIHYSPGYSREISEKIYNKLKNDKYLN